MKKTILITSVIIGVILIVVFVRYIRKPPPQPEIPPASNSWIMDKPAIEDELPRPKYRENQWWAWYGYAHDDNGNEILLNANIYPLAGVLYGNSYTLNGIYNEFWFISISWDEVTRTLYGEMKRTSDGKIGSWSLKFIQDGYRIYTQEVGEDVFNIEIWSYGIPLWVAKTEEQMLQYGLWSNGDPVYVGGFSDNVIIKVNLTKSMQSTTFNGLGIFENIWVQPTDLPQSRTNEVAYGFIAQKTKFYIIFAHSRNPYDLTEDLTKTGRIGFPDKAYTFDNFTYTDDYHLLENFKLQGTFEDGGVNLTGKRVGWLHEKQLHPFIKWTGTITRNGKTIDVNSLGSGEFRRLKTPMIK